MTVKGNNQLTELIARKLHGIEGVPTREAKRMIAKATKAIVGHVNSKYLPALIATRIEKAVNSQKIGTPIPCIYDLLLRDLRGMCLNKGVFPGLLHRCPTCGAACHINKSKEGTQSFKPLVPYEDHYNE